MVRKGFSDGDAKWEYEDFLKNAQVTQTWEYQGVKQSREVMLRWLDKDDGVTVWDVKILTGKPKGGISSMELADVERDILKRLVKDGEQIEIVDSNKIRVWHCEYQRKEQVNKTAQFVSRIMAWESAIEKTYLFEDPDFCEDILGVRSIADIQDWNDAIRLIKGFMSTDADDTFIHEHYTDIELHIDGQEILDIMATDEDDVEENEFEEVDYMKLTLREILDLLNKNKPAKNSQYFITLSADDHVHITHGLTSQANHDNRTIRAIGVKESFDMVSGNESQKKLTNAQQTVKNQVLNGIDLTESMKDMIRRAELNGGKISSKWRYATRDALLGRMLYFETNMVASEYSRILVWMDESGELFKLWHEIKTGAWKYEPSVGDSCSVGGEGYILSSRYNVERKNGWYVEKYNWKWNGTQPIFFDLPEIVFSTTEQKLSYIPKKYRS